MKNDNTLNLEQEKDNLYQIQKQLELYTITVDALTSVQEPYFEYLVKEVLNHQHRAFQDMINTIEGVIRKLDEVALDE